MPTPIKKQKLLLVEGKDEVNFFEALLKKLQRDEIQVYDCGGNIKFKTEFPLLTKLDGFSNLTSYAIVQDGDQDAVAALQRVQYVLKEYNQPTPNTAEEFSKTIPSVGIFIMPGDGESGMLEDLCLKSIQDTALLGCVSSYVDALSVTFQHDASDSEFGRPPSRSKALSLAALAATKGPRNQLGLAALAGYFDFEHQAFIRLLTFIEQL